MFYLLANTVYPSIHQAKCQILIIGEQTHSVQDFHAMMAVLVPGLATADPMALKSDLVPHLKNIIALGSASKE